MKNIGKDLDKLSKDDLRIMHDIAGRDINYCDCKEQLDIKYIFCDHCEKPIYGIDEIMLRSLIATTGAYKFLKSK